MDFSWLTDLLWLGDPPEQHDAGPEPAPPPAPDAGSGTPGTVIVAAPPGTYEALAGAPGTAEPATPIDYGANQDFMDSLNAQMDHANEVYRDAMAAAGTAPPLSGDAPPADPYHVVNSLLQGDIVPQETANSIRDQELRTRTTDELSQSAQDIDQSI